MKRKQQCLIIIFAIGMLLLPGVSLAEKKAEKGSLGVEFFPALDVAIGASYGDLENDEGEKKGSRLLALIRSGLGVLFLDGEKDSHFIYYSKILGEFNFSNDGAKYHGFDLRSGASVGALACGFMCAFSIDVGVTWSLLDFDPRPVTFLSIGLPIITFVQVELQHDWRNHRFGTLLKLWFPF